MREYQSPSEESKKIHGQIITICTHLYSKTTSKKHGGYLIYEDDKVKLSLDTYVPNVSAVVKLPNDKTEYVFGCSYHGNQVTYHKGKWEQYLTELNEKAVIVANQKSQEAEEKRKKKEELAKAPCSSVADEVFA